MPSHKIMCIKGNILTNLHQQQLTSTLILSDKPNFSKHAVLSSRSAGSDMKMRWLVMFHAAEDSFSGSNGKNCHLFADMSKEIKHFLGWCSISFKSSALFCYHHGPCVQAVAIRANQIKINWMLLSISQECCYCWVTVVGFHYQTLFHTFKKWSQN